ncbi:hypothetical protein BRCON_0340 [Candidatus Sumerlaea chitinivorans]|uniref:Uncharacterized protein n=1 Tax=Sumerlaea chitinivorans TaxID=2250252 RepID=A0A2Z4Y1P4_SUMC1|nr:hypothetical protein BRCON_0340 [Candidatus Sumerlaea chitinivorans]
MVTRQEPPVVTTHTLSLIQPDKPVSFQVEGQRLANCRIYLRRYGLETELNPTRRSDNLLQFDSQHLAFLESGDYDLVVRGPDGSEWTFAGAARVP